jgi:hypothetical protein
MREDFNRAAPVEDISRFSSPIEDLATKLTQLARSTADPARYGQTLAQKLCPVTLPYELDTPASFTVDRLKGRGLADDGMDVILTLATNTPLTNGVAPDTSRTRDEFPYFGEPFESPPRPHLA